MHSAIYLHSPRSQPIYHSPPYKDALSLLDFHHAKYKEAGRKLSEKLDPQDFKRWNDIREAARTAIALEAGIIDTIPDDGRLKRAELRAAMLLIRRYELSEIAA